MHFINLMPRCESPLFHGFSMSFYLLRWISCIWCIATQEFMFSTSVLLLWSSTDTDCSILQFIIRFSTLCTLVIVHLPFELALQRTHVNGDSGLCFTREIMRTEASFHHLMQQWGKWSLSDQDTGSESVMYVLISVLPPLSSCFNFMSKGPGLSSLCSPVYNAYLKKTFCQRSTSWVPQSLPWRHWMALRTSHCC